MSLVVLAGSGSSSLVHDFRRVCVASRHKSSSRQRAPCTNGHSSFLVLPPTFDEYAQLRVSKTVVGIFGIALLVTGFSLTGLTCFVCRSRTFQADFVFLPSLTSCVLGFLTVFYCFIISSKFVWNVATLLIIAGSALGILVYAALFVQAQRKISAKRKVNEVINMRPEANSSSPGSSYHQPLYFENHFANMYPAARPKDSSPMPHPALTEEELIQQQMLMLLKNKAESQTNPSEHTSANAFNRIDFTPQDEPGFDFATSSNPPSYGRYTPVPRGQGLEYLQPWDGVWRGNGRPPQQQHYQDFASRERRRREIERGG